MTKVTKLDFQIFMFDSVLLQIAAFLRPNQHRVLMASFLLPAVPWTPGLGEQLPPAVAKEPPLQQQRSLWWDAALRAGKGSEL